MYSRYIGILRCPNSVSMEDRTKSTRGQLRLIDAEYSDELIRKGTLQCSTCGEKFPIKDGVPNLLPTRMRKYLEGKGDEKELTLRDKEIVKGIEWSGKMVPSYHENVVDPFSSAPRARFIERYEDLYIDSVLDEYTKNKKEKVIFIEMGVGTGRYLIRYGSRLLNKEEQHPLKSGVCQAYRKDPILRKHYSYDVNYDRNLRMLIGIDFQEGMIERSIQNLKSMKLYSLFGKRILLFVGVGQYFDLALEQVDEFKNSFKVITCVFQTLGNQKEELQIELLKALKRLALPRGVIVVSVFNKEMFDEFGLKKFYAIDVKPTVGELREDPEALELRKEGTLITSKGVYSRWFSREDLKRIFKSAGLKVTLRSADQLDTFEDTAYISENMQKKYGKILIIAQSEVK